MIILRTILLSVVLLVAACGGDDKQVSGENGPATEPKKALVVTSNYPLYFFASRIAEGLIDVAKSRGISIDAEKLSEILDVPVVPIIARSGKGKDKLMDAVLKVAQAGQNQQPLEISYGEDIDSALLEMELIINQSKFLTETYPSRWTALNWPTRGAWAKAPSPPTSP